MELLIVSIVWALITWLIFYLRDKHNEFLMEELKITFEPYIISGGLFVTLLMIRGGI